MTIIYTNQKSNRVNKKPGWKQAESDYNKWLNKVNSMTLFNSPIKVKQASAIKNVQIKAFVEQKVNRPEVKGYVSCGKPVNNPYVMYKDDPEMLERELKARELIEEKKHRTAPVYNKGGSVFMSDDMIKDMMNGSLRRRS